MLKSDEAYLQRGEHVSLLLEINSATVEACGRADWISFATLDHGMCARRLAVKCADGRNRNHGGCMPCGGTP